MMKRLMVLLTVAATIFLTACDAIFFWPLASTATLTTTQPGETGTITFVEADYYSYPYYSSPNYQLDNIDAYSDVLLATRDHIRRANVRVHATIYRVGQIFPGLTQTLIEGSSAGSGVVFLERDGYYYFLTNHHVIDDRGYDAEYEVEAFGDETPVVAELVADDEDLDLAVLRFPSSGHPDVALLNLTTRLSTRFTPGELVLAVGNPLSVDNNVTFGEFKSLQAIANSPFKVIYHSATIQEGSSGGALVDIDGNLLGLNAWGTTDDDEQSFAIPLHIIHVFLVNNGLWP